MKSIFARLGALEALPCAERVRVTFSDNTTQYMSLPGVIPCLVETDGPRVVGIDAKRINNADGLLLELVRGLLPCELEEEAT